MEVRGAEVRIGSHPLVEFARDEGLVNSSDKLIIQPEYLTVGELTCWKTTIPGIGMKVHEWPRITSNSSALLQKGYTVTIEPGVYFPGEFGIRIEDTILIDSNTCERLSTIGRDLLVI